MRYHLVIWKRRIEDLIIWPFVAWGRWRASRAPGEPAYDIWFLFPFFHTGGAEKVHAQLAQAFAGRKAIILFTRHSQDQRFRAEFEKTGHRVMDISAYTDQKQRYWNNLVMRGRISHLINSQQKRPVVINGQCNFAYKLSRWVRKDIPQVELIHSLNSFSYIRIPFLPFYCASVMISKNRIADHLALYERYGIPSPYAERIIHIGNGVPMPADPVTRNTRPDELHVLYAGRGTVEKRVHLVDAILRKARSNGQPVKGIFMGDVDAGLKVPKDPADEYLGNLSDPEKIEDAYQRADILIITSSEEGFPMVVMEAMGHGCAIIATPVGDIPLHVKPGVNGWLFTRTENEEEIISEGADYLEEACRHRVGTERMGHGNIAYARAQFGLGMFEERWRALLDHINEEDRP